MTRLEAWLFHASNALVAVTGLVYGWMVYFAKSDDPYAIVNPPLQPTLQHLHGVLAPALVFMAGVVWQRHALRRLQSGARARRASGIALIALLAPMIASGYLLQTATGEHWRAVWVGVHLATSLAWIVGTLAHLVARKESAASSAQSRTASSATLG